MKHEDDLLLTEVEVSKLTKLSLSTLRSHRQKGIGLPYVKIEKSVRYKKLDILDYIEKHTVKSSQAD